MSTIKLSEQSFKAIKAYADVSVKASKGLIKAVDSLYADGVTVEALTAPKGKDADRSFYDSVCSAVVAGFSEAARKMVLLGAKDLADVSEDKAKANRELICKINARYWQQQVGSKIKDMRNALERRLRSTDSNGAEENKSTWESTKRKVLAEIITQAQKKEASKITDLAAFIKDLQSALARIPADA